ncbi:MAG: TIGR02147 family protein [Pseudobdellovibrionaceae bacterium]
MKKTVFEFTNYKDFIRHQIDQNQVFRGYRTLLARAAGCQRTFLSQVLNSHVELTPEHAVAMATFWKLGENESAFFLELLNLSRAGTPLLRKVIETRLEQLRRDHEKLSSRLREPRISVKEHEMLYYSSWVWAALHVVVSIPEFQTAPRAAERLKLPLTLVEEGLVSLENMGLVASQGTRWRATAKSLHLPEDSPSLWMHHRNWRDIALREAQKSAEAIHYTSIHALSENDVRRLEELLRNFIVESRKIVEPSREEKMICLCCDLFPL